MVEKIVIGKDRKDLEKYGEKGTAFIGKHTVGKGEDSHLTNPVLVDVTRPHVMLVCGKRGSGKSYSAGVMAEEIHHLEEEIKENLCVLMIDTMGIYWSMKVPNDNEMEKLKDWGLRPEALDAMLFVPKPAMDKYKEVGVEVNSSFSLTTGDMTAGDWVSTFGFSMIDDKGITITNVMKRIRSSRKKFSIDDIIAELEKDEETGEEVKKAVKSRFLAAKDWGLFEEEGTKIEDILKAGRITILDVSHYMRMSESWSIRGMVIALLSRKIFQRRLEARKAEEYGKMTGGEKKIIPMIWMMIDEAHQFMPNEGSTVATDPLLTIIKEGREPGISMLMITQRPEKLHPDALSQSDIVLSHRLTSKADLSALRSIMQTYMMEDIKEYINSLPKEKGAAIIMDDNSERIFPMQVRPRFSWHAGGSPIIIKEKGLFDNF